MLDGGPLSYAVLTSPGKSVPLLLAMRILLVSQRGIRKRRDALDSIIELQNLAIDETQGRAGCMMKAELAEGSEGALQTLREVHVGDTERKGSAACTRTRIVVHMR